MSEQVPAAPSLARRIIAHPASLLLIGFALMVVVGELGSVALNKLFSALDVARNTPVRLIAAVVLAALFIGAYKGYKRRCEGVSQLTLSQLYICFKKTFYLPQHLAGTF